MLNAVSGRLVEDGTVALRPAQERTQRSEVYQAREDDNPAVHGINHVATIELQECLG